MAAPTYVAASTGATDAGGAWTSTGVAGTSGNVVILQILQDGATANVMGTPPASGSDDTRITWTNVASIAGTASRMTYIGSYAHGSTHIQHLWIGRLSSTSAPTAAGGNTTSEDLYWRWYEFTNVNTGTTLAAIIEQNGTTTPSTSSGTSGTIADAGVTTTGPDRLALNFVSISDDNALAGFSGQTGTLEWVGTVSAYSESSGTDGTIGLQKWQQCWTQTYQGTGYFGSVAYGNGYWVAVGPTGNLYYTTDITGSWTSNPQGSTEFISVAYGNGYWVAVGASGTLYYKATDPTGTWTSNTQGTLRLADVKYGNGYWVAVGGEVAVSEQVLYKASTPDGTWTQNLTASSGYPAYTCEYGNGYWVVTNLDGGLYYQATNPTGSWTSNTSPGVAQEARYLNGYWVTTADPVKYRASDPTGTFTASTYGVSSGQSIDYGGGYYIQGSPGSTWTATAVDGAWTEWTQDSAYKPRYLNGYFVAAGVTGRAALIKYTTNPVQSATIPAGTIDGGTTANSDATDGWGCVGFALIGTTVAATSLLARPHRPTRYLLRR